MRPCERNDFEPLSLHLHASVVHTSIQLHSGFYLTLSLILPLSSHLALGKFFNVTKSQFPYLGQIIENPLFENMNICINENIKY
jgi:hypothetical protein